MLVKICFKKSRYFGVAKRRVKKEEYLKEFYEWRGVCGE
jgi:hypothetical protein